MKQHVFGSSRYTTENVGPSLCSLCGLPSETEAKVHVNGAGEPDTFLCLECYLNLALVRDLPRHAPLEARARCSLCASDWNEAEDPRPSKAEFDQVRRGNPGLSEDAVYRLAGAHHLNRCSARWRQSVRAKASSH